MGKLDGRTALVTGASRGQGEAEARVFVDEGAAVVIADVLEDEGRGLADELGEAALFAPLDVTSEEDWARAVAAATESFGSLDVLVNNAGILHFAPLTETSLEDYRRVIEVNQVGVFLGMRAAAAAMADGGSIINISSIDGLMGMPGVVAYCASKFAVCGMTKVAALELASRGIRVNSIHPGVIETPMIKHPALEGTGIIELVREKIPMARSGATREIATVAAFLASDESSYCTGAELVIDGGITSGMTFQMG